MWQFHIKLLLTIWLGKKTENQKKKKIEWDSPPLFSVSWPDSTAAVMEEELMACWSAPNRASQGSFTRWEGEGNLRKPAEEWKAGPWQYELGESGQVRHKLYMDLSIWKQNVFPFLSSKTLSFTDVWLFFLST